MRRFLNLRNPRARKLQTNFLTSILDDERRFMNYAPRFLVRKVREIQLAPAYWFSQARGMPRGVLAGRKERAKDAGASGKFKLVFRKKTVEHPRPHKHLIPIKCFSSPSVSRKWVGRPVQKKKRKKKDKETKGEWYKIRSVGAWIIASPAEKFCIEILPFQN